MKASLSANNMGHTKLQVWIILSHEEMFMNVVQATEMGEREREGR